MRATPFVRLAASALASVAAAAAFAAPAPPPTDILGVWRGTSLCVDHVKDPACHDEQVVYRVERAEARRDSVTLHAFKIVGGQEQWMGDQGFTYRPRMRAWLGDFHIRRSGRWTFRVQGRELRGTLTELPGGRLVRRVNVRRDAGD